MAGILNAELAFPQFPALDQYGPNTTLLLHGDGTNGAQNNTFLDSSANNFTITRNGNTTQGTFSPFSQPNGYWSNYFNQSGFLYNTSTSVGSFGTNNFTVECWFYITGGDGSYRFICDTRATGSGVGIVLILDTSNNLLFTCNNTTYLTCSQPPKNQWIHVAVCRTGTGSNQLTMYINGSVVATNTLSTNISSSYCVVGAGGDSPLGVAPWLGYISNFRMVSGTAVYTSNFTPPTTPLTAITNTVVLTCQSNRFVDNSSSPVTFTVSGAPSVQAFHPISAPTAYYPAVNGGAGYFDGSGDYLATPTNTNLSLGTNDFAVEAWVYFTTNTATQTTICGGPGTTVYDMVFGYTYNGAPSIVLYLSSTGSSWDLASGVAMSPNNNIANSWNHIALTRSGSTFRTFFNGVQQATFTSSASIYQSANQFCIGSSQRGGAGNPNYMNGYISNARIVIGSPVYTSNFTPSTAPLTAITNTQLLLSSTNAGIIDSVSQNQLETVGNAQVSTTQSKFGGASMYFDGTGDYLLAPSTTNWDFGTGDFTVEFWVYFSSVTTCSFIGKWGSGAGKYAWITQYITSTSNLTFYTGNNGSLGSAYNFSWSPSTGIWYHVAFTRSGSSLRAYINGNQIGTTQTNSDSLTASGAFCCIGENLDGGGQSQFVNGYIDDLRITKGIARYTQNFTPPQNAYPNYGPLTNIPTVDPNFKNTTLLLHGNGTNGAQNNTFLDSSTNNFAITRNGNTTQGTFTPFSQPNGWWSNYFNGNGDQLTAPVAAISGVGSSNFSFECWVYALRQTNTYAQGLISYGPAGVTSTSSCISFQLTSAGYLASTYAAGDSILLTDPVLFPINQWTHCVVCRSGSTISLFKNGARVATSSTSATVGSGGDTLAIGGQWYANATTRQLQGYISNARIVNGASAYDATQTTITVPILSLSAITSTSLLTCQSNRFIDNSSNSYAITVAGTPTVQNFYPFFPPLDYSTAAIGGSAYFDGSGDYLSAGSNAAFAFGTGAYTVEMWVNPSSISQQVYLFNDTTGGSGFYFETNSSAGFTIAPRATGSPLVTGGYSSLKANAWNHVVFCRASTSSNQTSIFVNGTRVANGTDNTNWTVNGPCLVGGLAAGIYMFAGYMSQVRVVKGTDVYGYSNTSITVPTTPLTAITNTSLLLSCTNAGIFDNASKNDLETVGNAQISTTQSKFGGSSMYFDASGSYLSCPSNPNIAFGTGDFTIEYWMYSNDVSTNQKGMLQTSDTVGGLKTTYTTGIIMFQGYSSGGNLSGGIGCNIAGTTLASSGAPLTTGAWYHVALVRASGVVTIYVNGNSVASATITTSITGTYLAVGGYYSTSYTFNGYIDDFRITAGIARYRYNFTPPAAPFPNK